jgi:hypothetical protein
LEKIESLMHLAARPEVAADTEDTMEFSLKRNRFLRFIFK